ncbi:MAG: threonine/serine dehydratase [Pseudomonadota bacterium]
MNDISLMLSDIEAADKRIDGYAVRTPLLQSPSLNEKSSAKIYIKPENLQRAGSFKFRGAFNRLSQLSETQRKAGVVAWSSGNHAQGIAAAAQILDIPAAIVMPSDAPHVKMQKTRDYGAEIITYDRYSESREDIGRRLAKERGCTLVPSYDDLHIMAGQGTAGLEMVHQLSALGVKLDSLLVCCGGGGLIAGISTAFKSLSPDTNVYSVEPRAFNDHERSLVSGRREQNPADARSICDALLAPEPGEMTFAVNQKTLAGGVSVTDDEVRDAMRFAYDNLKLVVEPGGAVALSAALTQKVDIAGQNVGVIISGGNVDPVQFADIISLQAAT